MLTQSRVGRGKMRRPCAPCTAGATFSKTRMLRNYSKCYVQKIIKIKMAYLMFAWRYFGFLEVVQSHLSEFYVLAVCFPPWSGYLCHSTLLYFFLGTRFPVPQVGEITFIGSLTALCTASPCLVFVRLKHGWSWHKNNYSEIGSKIHSSRQARKVSS